MKLLPFEGRYLLETSPCPRCDGSGLVSHAPAGQSNVCYNCRGWGRKASSAGLKLFYAICDLLGHPMSQALREGRVEPKHLDTIFGRDVQVGMMVRVVAAAASREWPEAVVQMESVGLESKRIHLADGSVKLISMFSTLDRVLTAEEVERVQVFMAQHVGKGAVEATS